MSRLAPRKLRYERDRIVMCESCGALEHVVPLDPVTGLCRDCRAELEAVS